MDSISAQHLTFSPYSFTKSRYIIVTCVHTYSKYNVCTGETRKISRGIREKLGNAYDALVGGHCAGGPNYYSGKSSQIFDTILF